MSKRKLSDVNAIASTPMRGDATISESTSLSVRQIENGYVCTESRSDGSGYHCREYYSETKPKLEAYSARPGVVGDERFGGARSALGQGFRR